MATDHTTPIEPKDTEEPIAYISPTVDFLLLVTAATTVAIAGTAVLLP